MHTYLVFRYDFHVEVRCSAMTLNGCLRLDIA